MSTSLLIVGYGDIGRRVASLALAAGRVVSALVRSGEKAAALKACGIIPIIGDLDDTATPVRALQSAGTTSPRRTTSIESTFGLLNSCTGLRLTAATTPADALVRVSLANPTLSSSTFIPVRTRTHDSRSFEV